MTATIGQVYILPAAPHEKYRCWEIDSLFVYLRSEGWAGRPRTPKHRKFVKEGWVAAMSAEGLAACAAAIAPTPASSPSASAATTPPADSPF